MTEQEKQKLKDALIEHKNIAASEYDDEDAFVGIYFSDLVDIINNIMHNAGWHPVSEPPKEKDVEVIMLVDVSSPQFTNAPLIRVPIFGRYINGWPEDVNVKFWSYPPEEKE